MLGTEQSIEAAILYKRRDAKSPETVEPGPQSKESRDTAAILAPVGVKRTTVRRQGLPENEPNRTMFGDHKPGSPCI